MKKRILLLALALALTSSILAPIPASAVAPPGCVISFPDPNFEAAVRRCISKPTGAITQSDVADVKRLWVGYLNVSSVSGIEYFTSMTEFNCRNNNLTELDVSKNPNLEILECSQNQLTELDVSINPKLKELSCDNNRLTVLDISKNPELRLFDCYGNQLTQLDLSKNTALEEIYCSGNLMTELDLSQNTELRKFSCLFGQLTKLDLSKNIALVSLDCSYNRLTDLNVSNNTALKELYCYFNRLTDLDTSNNAALTYLYCFSNKLATLDVSRNTELEELDCGCNRLTELDVSKNTGLRQLGCYSNQLTKLDVSKNPSVDYIMCNSNQLTDLDVSKNTVLVSLYCDYNLLTKLDLSKNTVLTVLCCENNYLPDKTAIAGLDENNLDIFDFGSQRTSAPNLDTAAEWAKAEIGSALKKGFVPVYMQGNYNNSITRQEFCYMLVKFIEYSLQKDMESILDERGLSIRYNTFSDTIDMDILAAFALGITDGTKAPTDALSGSFTPDGPLTRQEAAVMIMRVCKVIGMDVSDPPASGFVDMDSAGSWARDGINFVSANGIMGGISAAAPTFDPGGAVTRQESIVIFDRIR